MGAQQNMFAYLARQKADFIKAFKNPAGYPVGVQDPDQTTVNVWPLAATWSWDADVNNQKAFIRTAASRDKEYWVSADKDFEYREPFLAFLGREYGVIRASVPGVLNADHILNAEFARSHGLRYVRLALVWGKFNWGYGGKIEKRLTKSPGGKPMYLIDYMIFMKLMEIREPTNPADYQNRRLQIASQLAGLIAEPQGLVLQGMDGFFLDLWPVL